LRPPEEDGAVFDNLNILKMARAKMGWLAQRQEVLANNVANADTPRFIPKDMKALDFKEVLTDTVAPQVRATVTNAQHIVPQTGPDPFKAQNVRRTYESSPDGNAVVLEEQMAKIGEAKGAYDTAASLYQKHVRMIRSALGNR
jgi:flagellar basal-body rod protein FlgB